MSGSRSQGHDPSNAGQTINRILGMFPREDEQQLRQRLSETLRYVVSQRLVNKINGGRLLVTKIMRIIDEDDARSCSRSPLAAKR